MGRPNPISSQIVKKICKGYILSTMKLTSLRAQLQHVLFNVRYLISLMVFISIHYLALKIIFNGYIILFFLISCYYKR